MLQIAQGMMFNAAIMSAAMVLLGAVVVFVLLYLVLERKKKTLIAAFLAALIGFGGFYWFMGKKTQVSPLDIPKPVVTETIRNRPDFVPMPRPRPHKKRAAKPAGQPLKICP